MVDRISVNIRQTSMKSASGKMEQKLKPVTKLLYGSGDIGFSMTTTIIGLFLLFFLTDVVGISPAVAGVAIFAGKTWDWVNDPLIGYISDRTRTRWGRRRPFLLFGALPFALAFALIWWIPPFQRDVFLAVYYAFAYMTFDTAASFVYMPYFALTPELSSSYDERTSITSYRMLFSILGSLIAFSLPEFMVGRFDPDNAHRVLVMGLTFGLASAAPLLLTFLGTRERTDYMAQAQPKIMDSLRAVRRNPVALWGLGIYLCTWIAIDIVQYILYYFLRYGIRRESQDSLILGSIMVSAILALPLWNRVAQRIDKRAAYIAGIAFWAVVQMVIMTLGASTPLGVLLVLCAFAGAGVAAAHVLPWAILPDAIEYNELRTGERHEGMFYSMVTLSHKFAASIAILLVGVLLEASAYRGNVEIQPPRAELVIRLITGPIPAVLLCLGILCAIFYPLSRERYNRIVAELEARRAAKSETAP
jgi:GPH family glycoside/pentoside/hexuronide:cation symporter